MRWLRRLSYLIFLAFWLIVMFFPCMAFTLAMQQQIQVGEANGRHLRIFLLQEGGNEGVGVEWERPYRPQSNCFITTVSYLMWAGKGENTAYCQCLDPQTQEILSTNPQSCNLP